MPGDQLSNLHVAPGLREVTFDLDALRRIGPAIGRGMRPTGIRRAEVTVPISPTGRVADDVLFEDAATPSQKYYLPRYRLRVGEASGRYEITTELAGGRWRITFALEGFPAPEIEAAAAGAAVLPHQLSATVTSGAGLVRTYPVAEFVQETAGTVPLATVVLVLTLEERDALLRAYTRDEDHAQIELQRHVSVAVPAAKIAPDLGMFILVKPDTLATPVILPDLVLANLRTAVPVPIEHVEPVPVQPEPEPGDGVRADPGAVLRFDRISTFRQRLAVDRSFGVQRREPIAPPRAPIGPGMLIPAERIRDGGLFDRGVVGPGIRKPSDVLDPFPFPFPVPVPDPEPAPQESLFTLASTTLPVSVPLRFDVSAHPYLFPSGEPSAAGGFATLVVPWPAEGPTSRNYVYFHDQAAGNVFYYLPDVFLVGQRDQQPYGPELSFTVGRTTEEGGAGAETERAITLLSAHLVPQTSPSRLFDATLALAAHVPGGSAPPELRAAVHPATCRLDLPGASITTAAPPDLVRGWWISEAFGFDDLRDVYAVLTTDGATSALLRGRVDVDIEGQAHLVPVEMRLDRLALPPLAWTESRPDAASPTVSVRLRNDGVTAVRVPELPAWVDCGGPAVAAAVAGTFPLELAPGEATELTVTPQQQPAGTGPPDVTLDVTRARTVVDPEKAVDQTLDRRVARLPRAVTVLTTEAGLGATGDPAHDLVLVALQFDGVSGAVTLDRNTLQRNVAVPVPLVDWLLDRGSGGFRFRQTLVRADGTSQTDPEWRSADTSLLVLPIR